MSLPLPYTGAAEGDKTGDKGRITVNKINAYLKNLDRQAALRAGTLGRAILGTGGDSMAGYAGGDQAPPNIGWSTYSPLTQMRVLYHDADFVVDSRSYAQGGYGYAVGGSTIAGTDPDNLRYVQLPRMQANAALGKVPDIMYLSAGQNETMFAVGSVATPLAHLQYCVDAILDLGITIVEPGIYPHSRKGQYTENAYSRHWFDNAMRNFAATRPNLHYVSVLDVLKERDYANENTGLVNWKAGYSNDEIHINPKGARAMAPLLGDVFRKLLRAYEPPTFDAMDFNDSRNPFGNYFGSPGLMLGTGGKINGVVSNDMPAGIELIYDATLGYSITPTIITVNGERVVRLTFSGTPTANDIPNFRIGSNKLFASGNIEIYGKVRWTDSVGMNGISLSCGRAGVGGLGNAGEYQIPGVVNETMILRNPRAAGFINQYGGSQVEYLKLETAVRAGVACSGSLDVYRMGAFRSPF